MEDIIIDIIADAIGGFFGGFAFFALAIACFNKEDNKGE